jgi:transposase
LAAATPCQTSRDRSERRLRTGRGGDVTPPRFVVVVLQPGQVRSYAKFCLQRAKNDHIDAALIAACTAALPPSKIYPPPDPRLVPLAAHLTLIDQLTDDIARLKTRRETCRDERLRRFWSEEVTRLKAIQRRETRELVAAIRRHADLGDRLDLIESVAGVGTKASIAILIRMPEIGRVSREAVAALAGLAPFDDNSADRIGAKHIEGGRERLRKTLYSATLSAAFHWNPQLIALYRRLAAQGKPHKVALIACARKLLVFVNAVVERGTPWVKQPAAA